MNRIIEFECSEKVYSDLPWLSNVIRQNYGFAGREFVSHLQEEGAFEAVNLIQKEFYQELLKTDSTEKQAAAASALLAADYIATNLIFKDGNNLTVEDMAAIMTKKDDVNVNKRAYEFILEMVTRNLNHFKTNEFGDYQGEIWGKIEKDEIYIIKSVFDREMQNNGYNSTAFLAWAKRLDLISTAKDKRTKVYRIAGAVTNCVCIKKPKESPQDKDLPPISEIDF